MESEVPETRLQQSVGCSFPQGGQGSMKTRWLAALGLLLLVTAPLFAQDPRGHVTPVGYLVAPAPLSTQPPALAPYEPRPGDIVLYDEFNRLHHFLFKFANTSAPTHVAMVI